MSLHFNFVSQHSGLLAWKVPPESPNPVPEFHNCYCKIPIPKFTQITLNWGLGFLLHPTTGKLFKPPHTDSNGNHLPVANLTSHVVTAHSFFPSREHLLLTSTAFIFLIPAGTPLLLHMQQFSLFSLKKQAKFFLPKSYLSVGDPAFSWTLVTQIDTGGLRGSSLGALCFYCYPEGKQSQ